jgi:long-chain acyl-CoA synthetase
MITGSAPMTQDCRDFLQIVFACPVLEGYGLTETCAVTTLATPAFPSGNHIGGPTPGIEMCLYDVPDMNYTSNDQPAPRGEVCVRGPSLFLGYFKDPERTAEAIDADGWFHTGDVGMWNADGTMSIIDRKKNIFKLSQGEYIAPEKIENICQKSTLVAQMLVHGYSTESYIVAIVIPDREAAIEWAKDNMPGFTPDDKDAVHTMLTSSELKKAIQTDVEAVATKFGLFRFERVAKIHLDAEPWTAANNLVTPTFKLKRPQLVQKYTAEIDAMYSTKK